MTSKTILVLAITAAFVAGTMTSGTAVFAADHGDKPNGKPFQDIWKVVTGLQTQIEDIKLMPGPQGPPGEKGDTADLNFYEKSSEFQLPGESEQLMTISCDAGDIAINGGTSSSSAGGFPGVVKYSKAQFDESTNTPTGWVAVVGNNGEVLLDYNIHVVCLEKSPIGS